MKNKLIFKIVLSGVFVCLLIVSSLIRIPLVGISITMQTLFVFLSGMILGYKWGTITIICYLVLGLLGLPIFSNGGGIFYVLEPTFGYLLGFILCSFVIGIIVKENRDNFKKLIISGSLGLFIIYLIGLLYYFLIARHFYSINIDEYQILIYFILIPLPIDLISVFISAIITKRISYLIKDFYN